MKQVTFDKYVDFLRALAANGTIYNMNDFKRTSHVGDAFVNFLIKSKYLKRLAGGSIKLVDCPLGFNHIVNEYKAFSEKKQPKLSTHDPKSTTSIGFAYEVADFGKALDKAYPKEDKGWIAINMDLTMEEREQAAIDILGAIMRDNAHITYDLIRIERKEVKTDLLAR
jgi:hypothetical protein